MEKLNFLKHINSHTHIKKLLKTEIGALLLTRFSVFLLEKVKTEMNIKKYQRALVFNPEVEQNRKNTVVANLSTEEGVNQNGEKVYSSWRTYFVGAAFEKAKKLQNKDLIIILSGKTANYYDKAKDKLYNNTTVFDFDWYGEKHKDKDEDKNNKEQSIPESFEPVSEESMPENYETVEPINF